MNDGFCDVCGIFKGHDDLKTLTGVFFCFECRELWLKLSVTARANGFKSMLGKAELISEGEEG